MNREDILQRVNEINKELTDSGFTLQELEHFWNDCFEEARQLCILKAQEFPMYGFSNLKSVLANMEQGDLFSIKGDRTGNWVFYDENKDYYFIKHNCHKQMVLIKKV